MALETGAIAVNPEGFAGEQLKAAGNGTCERRSYILGCGLLKRRIRSCYQPASTRPKRLGRTARSYLHTHLLNSEHGCTSDYLIAGCCFAACCGRVPQQRRSACHGPQDLEVASSSIQRQRAGRRSPDGSENSANMPAPSLPSDARCRLNRVRPVSTTFSG